MLPQIREYYINEVADKLGRLRPDEREEIEWALKQIDEEEERVLRLYAASHDICEKVSGDKVNSGKATKTKQVTLTPPVRVKS